MADPFLGKIAATAVKTQTQHKPTPQSQPGIESKFGQVLDQMTAQEDFMKNLGVHPGDMSPDAERFESISANNIDIPMDELINADVKEPGWGVVHDLLEDVVVAGDRMDFLTSEILSGGTKYSNQQLLALQAKIMKYSQITDVTVKLASETVSSIRQTLNTQVA